LNELATSGASYSVVIETNPARKLDLPTRLLQKRPCRRFYTLGEIRDLLAIAPMREHLVLRLFFVCGLRPSELFILRDDDIEPGRTRIDQALKEAEKGQHRIGEPGDTKTPDSAGYVALSRSLQEEIENWLMLRGE
jgi:integrase